MRSGPTPGLPVEPDDVVAAALATAGVVRLDPGADGEVATYLPGRRVHGVRVGDDRVEVHLVVDASRDVRETAAAVRSTVTALAPGITVDVVVADLQLPDGILAEPLPGTSEPDVSWP